MRTTAIDWDATSRLSLPIPRRPPRTSKPQPPSIPTRPATGSSLASAYQVTGNPAGQREALERALQAEPTAPDVAWEAANFFLVAGDMERAFHEFRVVIENEPPLAGLAMQSCWRASPDADAMLRDVIPARTDSLIAFLTFLMTRKETEGTIKTWDRLMQLHQKFEPARSVRLRTFSGFVPPSRCGRRCVGTDRPAARPLLVSAHR